MFYSLFRYPIFGVSLTQPNSHRNGNNGKESLLGLTQGSLPFECIHFPSRLGLMEFPPGNRKARGATTTHRCKLGCGSYLKVLGRSSDKALEGYSEIGWVPFSEWQSCLTQLSSESAGSGLYCQACITQH